MVLHNDINQREALYLGFLQVHYYILSLPTKLMKWSGHYLLYGLVRERKGGKNHCAFLCVRKSSENLLNSSRSSHSFSQSFVLTGRNDGEEKEGRSDGGFVAPYDDDDDDVLGTCRETKSLFLRSSLFILLLLVSLSLPLSLFNSCSNSYHYIKGWRLVFVINIHTPWPTPHHSIPINSAQSYNCPL